MIIVKLNYCDLKKLKILRIADIFETPTKINSFGYIDSFEKFFVDTKQKGKYPINTSKYGGSVDFIFLNKKKRISNFGIICIIYRIK